MSNPMSFPGSSIAELSERLDSGESCVVDVVSESLSRAHVVQADLNPFVFLWDDEALERAETLDRVPAYERGPMHGIPVAIKDTTPWAGHRLTLGSRTHEHHVATNTAWVVERLLDAGAVIIGSTNTPEFAHSSFTDNPLWGPTRNPWNRDRNPGGSSGGSAVAVATGCVPVADGTDMGGSVRIPAAWCGVVGLKPSLGRIPMDSLPGLWDLLSHHGPIARTVDDAWRYLRVTQGPSLRDPYSFHAPLLGDLDTDVRGLRVALSIDLGCWAVDPEIEASVRAAAERLRDRGAIVTEVDPGFTARHEWLWIEMWGVFMAGYFGHLLDDRPDQLDPDVVALIELGRSKSAVDARHLEIERSRFWKLVANVLDSQDVIMCPTMATAPFNAAKRDHIALDTRDDRHHSHDMTTVWNLASPCPAVSVPCGRHGDFDPRSPDLGLPIGAQLVARPGAERLLLSVANTI